MSRIVVVAQPSLDDMYRSKCLAMFVRSVKYVMCVPYLATTILIFELVAAAAAAET